VDDTGQVLRGPGLELGTGEPERLAVLVHGPDEALGHRLDRLIALGRALDALVIDVGDVANESDPIATMTQIAAHEVEHREHSRMTDVQIVVHGHATDIHPHVPGRDRLQQLLLTRHRIVNANGDHDRFDCWKSRLVRRTGPGARAPGRPAWLSPAVRAQAHAHAPSAQPATACTAPPPSCLWRHAPHPRWPADRCHWPPRRLPPRKSSPGRPRAPPAHPLPRGREACRKPPRPTRAHLRVTPGWAESRRRIRGAAA